MKLTNNGSHKYFCILTGQFHFKHQGFNQYLTSELNWPYIRWTYQSGVANTDYEIKEGLQASFVTWRMLLDLQIYNIFSDELGQWDA